MMRSFLALRGTRVFFSLNAKQLVDPRIKKAAICCKELPLEVLLFETDAPDQAPNAEHVEDFGSNVQLFQEEGSAGINEPALVKLALKSAARIRDVAIDDLAVAVYQNSKEAFNIDSPKLN
ncbi:unnamed protein product [Phytophthora fragariaefolia]|uniref:Unnamed protein product n=1 Tax=Phytophthora fragariaefolia TaxID=1490495 RepID=A0A9W6U9V1_9STRA|nr:unnamed protein product [Phytophthora fragariaefolia]